ncbi:MAG: hypothetical protein IKM31_10560 [Oscillospiraceae bacterium]|nr:hypothetical protein [Oscillospiraceae bacterium]
MISFRFCGTLIRLHFSFFAVLCLYLQLGEEPWGSYCIWAALLHESGHLLAFAAQKTPPLELHFRLGGIRLIPPPDPLPFPGELLTLLGGSLMSFLCGILLHRSGLPEAALPHFFTGIFSLLPLPGLDGGEILALFWSRFLPDKEPLRRKFQKAIALCLILASLLWSVRSGTPGGLLLAAVLTAALRSEK